MKAIKALIIDDEKSNREFLAGLLSRHCPSITQIDEAGSAEEALIKVTSNAFDVVFLDIEMPGGTGFDFLDKAGDVEFHVIFVTAYDSYALKAIRFSALDYILKPVSPEDLVRAVERLDKMHRQKRQMEVLRHNLQSAERRVALSTQEEIILVKISEIIRLQAEANYTRIFLQSDAPVLLSGNLGYYEDMLNDEHFFRCHQTHLINLSHVRKYVKTDGGFILMSDGFQAPVARMRKEELKYLLGIT